MRKLIYPLLLISSFGIAWYLPRLILPKPCVEPLNYYIGEFDNRFDITRSEFIKALSDAERVWESASGRNLFSYSGDKAELPINLIYDYRQEVTEELSEIEENLEETEATYELLESRYKNLKNEYEVLNSSYENQVREFEARSAAYEGRVEEWNKGPRTSKSEFNAMERERLSLNAEVDRLRVIETNLNQKARELNSLVDRMNRLARTLNLNVEEYNAVGATRGETYEGGVYFEQGRERGINIYEFSNHDKLVRLLAHELGHALGLEHIEDPNAIMYKLNQSKNSTPTQADIEALEALCENTVR